MKLLTALLSCLLSLLGCDPRPSTTSITRASDGGEDTIFSKTTLVDGVATFECFASRSGGCRYRLYEERCDAMPAGAQAGCRRVVLDEFELQVGKRRRVQGLPDGFRHCVAAGDATDACRG